MKQTEDEIIQELKFDPNTGEIYSLGRPFVRSAYNYDRNAASDESALECPEPTMTQQSFAQEVDINTIVKRFGISGEMPTGIRMPTYGDFTGVSDFHTAMNAVALANESFDAMPAEVRARFNNDPEQFVHFCSDQNNLDEARKMGLVPAAELEKAANLTQATKPLTGGSTQAPQEPASPPTT